MLKTGKKCKWEDIKVGEIFAYKGCWQIHYKETENTARLIADDYAETFENYITTPFSLSFGGSGNWSSIKALSFDYNLYKLPKSVQSLWICN